MAVGGMMDLVLRMMKVSLRKKKQRSSAEQSQNDLAFLHQRHRKVSLMNTASNMQLSVTLICKFLRRKKKSLVKFVRVLDKKR